MAELHVMGQIVSASGFGMPSLFCKFAIETGSNFRLLQGTSSGQTQCDMPLVSFIFSLSLLHSRETQRAPPQR
jgi:hypothetical protein